MTSLRYPALCPNCGLMFNSGFTFGVRTTAFLAGCQTQCPRCLSPVPVPDGALEVLRNSIRVFSAPDFTVDVLRSLEVSIEDLRVGRVTAHEAERAINTVHPGLAREFREWTGWGFTFIAAMAAVASVVLDLRSQPHSNRTIEEVAVEAFEGIYDTDQPDLRMQNASTANPAPDPEQPNAGQQRMSPQEVAPKPNRHQRRAATAKARRQR